MSFWTAVVVLFAIGCVTWLKAQRYQALGDKRGPRAEGYDHTAREHELEREVEEMRKRIIVLERIATDEKHGNDLAREIEKLR
ncbi:hypothetical protein V474_22580 [Novosphingobium barchaimii LL02]|uniref:Uncharacterized protein n=1 Tax=Novosphingobium barchaimii LL02 TaxID=1114963 RepID=A0A0J7XPC7_9SPHN|nr:MULTISPECIES: hypothetical protein [Novosphingobium]AXB75828.1 hypothetical protein TQ38_004270 [Novosphingobium sp. P6W]KIS32963.1 hypothetical protein TQ38_05615 [Novosphingobium sp. P6W]KMS53502.1 hypothetical protein V474_22580 [Novosphingobium barchaimii LL02]